MKYVIDSSVAVKWYVSEKDSDHAVRLQIDIAARSVDVLTTDFFPLEVMHTLTKAERQGRLNPGQAGTHWLDLLDVLPALYESLPLVPRAYEISTSSKTGIFDCTLVALAEEYDCELLTADDRLIRNLKGKFPFIVPIADYP